jgi:ferredoxin
MEGDLALEPPSSEERETLAALHAQPRCRLACVTLITAKKGSVRLRVLRS